MLPLIRTNLPVTCVPSFLRATMFFPTNFRTSSLRILDATNVHLLQLPEIHCSTVYGCVGNIAWIAVHFPVKIRGCPSLLSTQKNCRISSPKAKKTTILLIKSAYALRILPSSVVIASISLMLKLFLLATKSYKSFKSSYTSCFDVRGFNRPTGSHAQLSLNFFKHKFHVFFRPNVQIHSFMFFLPLSACATLRSKLPFCYSKALIGCCKMNISVLH